MSANPSNFLDCVQGSELWAKLRCGYITPSRLYDALNVYEKGKNAGKFTAERENYRIELICERLTGNPYPHFVTREMQWGLDHEAEAATEYELDAGVLVERCGFVLHPEVSMFGASPDRLVGDDGLMQIKCPTTKTHLSWKLRKAAVPAEYLAQIQGELSCTGREWCDFVSFDPRLPEHLQLFVQRVHRDDTIISALEREVADFNREIESELRSLLGPQPAAKLLEMPKDDEVEL